MLQNSMNLQVAQSRNKEKYSIYNKRSIKFFALSTRLTLIQDDNSISYSIESIPLLKNPFNVKKSSNLLFWVWEIYYVEICNLVSHDGGL